MNELLVTLTAPITQAFQSLSGVSVHPSLYELYPLKVQTTTGIVPDLNCVGKVIVAVLSTA
nr:MAG TPA: hypothetical protein [Caudoviricetes sp.]